MGRLLGLDYGTRRVGAAVSDPDRRIASPLEVYERREAPAEARHYRALVEQHGIERIVVGLPVRADGRMTPMAEQARAWGSAIAEAVGRPVVFFDERYSSVEAEEILMGAGVRRAKRTGKRDMIAASLLLQAYMDAGCPESYAPDRLDDPADGPG
jgi:putative Holliday junction resolvase